MARPSTHHDPTVLRAIAHPLRTRILAEVEAAGPMRAADIAAALGVPANQASFHLRQLAKYGLVVEAPEAARDGRDRVWKSASDEGLHLDLRELAEAPGGKAAVEVWRRENQAWAHRVVDAAYAMERRDDAFGAIGERVMRLTKEEAEQLADELDEVLERWGAHRPGDDQERRTYLHFAMLQVYPEQA